MSARSHTRNKRREDRHRIRVAARRAQRLHNRQRRTRQRKETRP